MQTNFNEMQSKMKMFRTLLNDYNIELFNKNGNFQDYEDYCEHLQDLIYENREDNYKITQYTADEALIRHVLSNHQFDSIFEGIPFVDGFLIRFERTISKIENKKYPTDDFINFFIDNYIINPDRLN